MENTQLLFYESDETWKIRKEKNEIIVKCRSNVFNGNTFFLISKKITKIINTPDCVEKIINFKFNEIHFSDKAAYICFEVLLYSLMKEYNFTIKINIKPTIQGLYSGDIEESLIFKYKLGIIDKDKYIKDFEKKEITSKKFRLIAKRSEKLKNPQYISLIYDEITYFLKTYTLDDEEFRETMSEAIVELVGNASEHSESDCLLDITIVPDLKRKAETDLQYIGFDIVILNLSNTLLGDGIKKIMQNKNEIKNPQTYNMLKEAFKNHKEFFTKKYDEDFFYNVSTFQWRVSSRKDTTDNSGGTGLPTLIKNLILKSESRRCYVMSGDRVIFFKNEFLKTDDGKIFGFNKTGDFSNKPPDDTVLERTLYQIKGTLYNLNFIKKWEKKL